MRYFFRGFIKQTGTPVYGHAEASTEDAAYEALSRNGVVTESLKPDPVVADPPEPGPSAVGRPFYDPSATSAARTIYNQLPGATAAAQPGAAQSGTSSGAATPGGAQRALAASGRPASTDPADAAPPTELNSALNNALDAASSQVSFDALAEKYKGKRVWVVDREKIRYRVAKVVDGILAQSSLEEENTEIRKRVSEAIQGLFGNDRNIATERTPETVAQMKAAQSAPAAPAQPGFSNQALEEQIDRLAEVVSRAESVLGSIALAANRMARGGGGGGGGGGRGRLIREVIDESQNEVLLEIFKSNLELRKNIADGGKPAAGASESAPAETSGSEPPGPAASVGGAEPVGAASGGSSADSA